MFKEEIESEIMKRISESDRNVGLLQNYIVFTYFLTDIFSGIFINNRRGTERGFKRC